MKLRLFAVWVMELCDVELCIVYCGIWVMGLCDVELCIVYCGIWVMELCDVELCIVYCGIWVMELCDVELCIVVYGLSVVGFLCMGMGNVVIELNNLTNYDICITFNKYAIKITLL